MAQVVRVGQPITETLQSRTDIPYHQFAASQSGRLGFRLRNLTATFAPRASILHPDGNRLVATTARQGDSIVTWFRATQSEHYGIRIDSRSSGVGTYTLELLYQQ